MNEVKILDCTLRDGAHINKGEFTHEGIKLILDCLGKASIPLIEVGFIENNTMSGSGNVYYPSFKHVDTILSGAKTNEASKFGVMIRTDRTPFSLLAKSENIDFVRIAFYPEHLEEVKKYTQKLVELDYSVYLNPIALTNYDEKAFSALLIELETMPYTGISLVDTYGALSLSQLEMYLSVLKRRIPVDKTIGLHLHQNLNRGVELSNRFINVLSQDYNLIIDTSVSGMGRVPGNFETEVLLGKLSDNIKKIKYSLIQLSIISDFLNRFRLANDWGYKTEYAISAMYNLDRTYPEYFRDQGCTLEETTLLLQKVKATQANGRFNLKLAEDLVADLT